MFDEQVCWLELREWRLHSDKQWKNYDRRNVSILLDFKHKISKTIVTEEQKLYLYVGMNR